MYSRIGWKDRAVERPRTYIAVQNEDGSVTFIPAPGTIYETGTPMSAETFGATEIGVSDAHLFSAIFTQAWLNFKRWVSYSIATLSHGSVRADIDQELAESEQAQARENINAPSADDVHLKLYSNPSEFGIAVSDALTLEAVCEAMPNNAILAYSPASSSTGNISPSTSRYGVLVIHKISTARMDVKYYPATGNLVFVNYAYYNTAWNVGSWEQITPVTEVSATLTTAWTGSLAPYTQAVSISGMTTLKKAVIGLPATATQAQYLAAADAMLRVSYQGAGTITVTAEGTKPTISIPILVEILG